MLLAKSSKLKASTDNRYDFIDLKESDLLVVTYYIKLLMEEIFDSIIAIPKVIEVILK